MARTKISEYDATAANNVDIDSINIAENCPPSGINNAIREVMAHLADFYAGNNGDILPVLAGGTGADNATDVRTNISAAKSGVNSDITEITGLTVPLSFAQGGLGSTDLVTARANLGLGVSNNVEFQSLGIGTAASGTAGEIRATNNITAYYSDDRLKTKLGNIEDALDKVCSLNGFYYHANQTAVDLGYEIHKEVGVSAQEVNKVLPEVISPAPIDEKYMTVHYDRLVPLLIEAIKDLKAEVDLLKGE